MLKMAIIGPALCKQNGGYHYKNEDDVGHMPLQPEMQEELRHC